MQSEYEQAGFDFDAGGIRVERLAEAVTIIKGLLKGEQVTFSGRHYHVTAHTIYPLPVQRPHPPILFGGNGLGLFTLAAREADIVGLSGITFRRDGAVPDISGWTVSEVDKRMQLIRNVAGDRDAQLELSALVQRVVVTDHRHEAAEELASRWTQLHPDEILESPYVLIGTVDQMVEDLQVRRERWGISYYAIFESYVDAFAPSLHGSPAIRQWSRSSAVLDHDLAEMPAALEMPVPRPCFGKRECSVNHGVQVVHFNAPIQRRGQLALR